jgi:putative transposase
VFFKEDDYTVYMDLMSEWCNERGVEVWAYCLMPNHVHLIAVPQSEESLRLAIGEAHRRYTRMINFREGWRGHLWQGRFASYVMDEFHLMSCARYIEMNPVRAGLADLPFDWPWSSASAHLRGQDDRLVKVRPLLDMVLNKWEDFLTPPVSPSEAQLLKRHERTGRPLGGKAFVKDLEKALGRSLMPQKPGRKPKAT